MKELDHIPENFNELAESPGLGDSDEITIRDLRQFDEQLKPFNLEIVQFVNGSALNWFIQQRTDEK